MTEPFNNQNDFKQFTKKKNNLIAVNAYVRVNCTHNFYMRILNSQAEYMHKKHAFDCKRLLYISVDLN